MYYTTAHFRWKLYSGSLLMETTYFSKKWFLNQKMENYILEKISGNARNGTFSAIGISGTAKYLKGFVQAKTFKDEAAGMGNA